MTTMVCTPQFPQGFFQGCIFREVLYPLFPIRPSGDRLRSCKHRQVLLAVCWILGILCGTFLSISAADLPLALMRGMYDPAVSIVSVLYVVYLPFLLSAFAVLLSAPAMILPVCFGKAFLCAYSFCCVFRTFGAIGWIISGIFLFPDWAALPVLYWYWRSVLVRNGRRGLSSFCMAAGILAGIAWLDLRIISPFGAGLIDFIERVNG